jgi:hypothetical protein
MPNHLEYVVRPSQAPQIRPGTPTQLLATPKTPENEPITWGSEGDSVFDLTASESIELPKAEWEKERTYDVVRVYNHDDHEQFVDTEQMTYWTSRNKIDKSRFTMRLDNNFNGPDTEVISKDNKRTSTLPDGP